GQLSAPNNHPDSYSMQILVCILGGYFGSRLNKSIREEKGYTYGISAHIASYLNKAHFSINTRTKNEVAIETVAAIHDEINNLLQYPVSDEELQTVRNLYITNIGTAFEHPLYISDTLIGLLANNLDFSYYTGFNQVLKTITPNELLNTAQKYWSKPMCEVLVGDFKADK
ncbi:MAG TPA: insulinase family protein, partial [Candidatus Enterocola sp.]|nr:insulinase family protein [Candidatus Enterocola sp.]